MPIPVSPGAPFVRRHVFTLAALVLGLALGAGWTAMRGAREAPVSHLPRMVVPPSTGRLADAPPALWLPVDAQQAGHNALLPGEAGEIPEMAPDMAAELWAL